MKTVFQMPHPIPETMVEAVTYFAEPTTALAFFANVRWPDGVVKCPHCGSESVGYLAKQGRWQCRMIHPRRQFTVKVGTVMEDSPLGLDKWAVAFWLEVNAKNSISSYEIHRALGITQKSAWFMLHRIRLAVHQGTLAKPMGGVVEADETYIGGAARNMHADKRKARVTAPGAHTSGKTAVMGLLERHTGKGKSRVRAAVIPNTKRKTLHPILRTNIAVGTTVCTDAHPAYVGIEPDFTHKVVDHAERYVDGIVHTNGLENFWSLFKRCIKGTHVSVEAFHLFRYLDAECFRFNNRDENDQGRFLLAMLGMSGKRLTYKDLTGKLLSEAVPPSGTGGANGSGGLPN